MTGHEVMGMAATDCANLRALGRLIADDSHALTFQTFGQYRAGLLAEVSRLLSVPVVPAEGATHE